MSDIVQSVETLSPERRALLLMLLKENGRSVPQSPVIARRGTGGALPLSYAQERMWFLDQLEPGSSFYNMFQAVSLKGRLNVAALEQSLREILRRHEALLATFSNNEGQPVQTNAPYHQQNLETIDLSLLPPVRREVETQRLVREEAQKPFDLARGALLRTTLLRLDEEEHVLLLTMHHIISDGWSMGILIREIAALYEAFTGKQPSPLADLPIQYGDYAQWQRDPAQLARLATELDYWKGQLRGAPPLVDLPTDRPRRSVNSFRGARLDFSFSAELTAEVKALAQREGASLFMTLLACWQVQLARESGQADIVVGTRTAGRTRAELEGLIGLFVNVLVLRTRVEEGASFREVLQQVREVALGGFEHQEVSFERLVQELEPARGTALTPLFNLMFVVQNAPQPVLNTPGLTISLLKVESTTAKYDLDLTLWETSDTLSGWLEFNTDLFDHETISRLLLRFQRCVAELVRQPLLPIHQLSLLSPEERREVVFDCNDTHADFPLHLPLHELFAAQVARTPDAVAVVDACQQLTYRELDQRSDGLTHYLQARGVAPEVPVAVLLDRSAETLITLLAIYKAGGVYVPLDAAAPRTHLDAILRQTRPPVIVTSAAYADRLPSHRAELIRLDADWQRIAEPGSSRPAPSGVSVDNLAYVMYTSGSTGQPKGVAVAQRQLLNRLHWMWRRYPFAADEVVCQRTTAGFSVSMWELLGGLLRGCRTVIVEDERAQDLGQLIAEMERQGVTRVVVVPSLLRALLEVEPGLCAKLAATRLWSVCGEALSAELAERFQAQAGGARLVNQYGASELNDVCFFDTGEEYGKHQESDAESAGSHRGKRAGLVPVGEPISNLSVYVLDARMRPVARGQRGEIYVRSISPARGYVGQAGATAERFVPDAVSGVAGGRLYRTGDVGRRVRGGRVEHLGRGDDQVKVRGMRVELKGVEALLKSHEGVAEAVVTARREGAEVTGLVGYVVKAAGGAGVSGRELREYVRERGGEQMVPAVVMELGEMPRLANGKVNRLALPDPLTAVAVSEKTFAPPRTKTEQTIAGIWQQVLGVDQVEVNQNFFELGGHSLALARVQSKLQAAFNKSISMIELFKNPTVSALARYFNDEQVENLTLQKAQQRAHKRRRAITR